MRKNLIIAFILRENCAVITRLIIKYIWSRLEKIAKQNRKTKTED